MPSASSILGRSMIVSVALLIACKRSIDGEKRRRITFDFKSLMTSVDPSSALAPKTAAAAGASWISCGY